MSEDIGPKLRAVETSHVGEACKAIIKGTIMVSKNSTFAPF